MAIDVDMRSKGTDHIFQTPNSIQVVKHVITNPVNAAGDDANAVLVKLPVAPQRFWVVATAAGSTNIIGNVELGVDCTHAGMAVRPTNR